MKQKFFWWAKRALVVLCAFGIVLNVWSICGFISLDMPRMAAYQLLPLVLGIMSLAMLLAWLKEEKEKTDE